MQLTYKNNCNWIYLRCFEKAVVKLLKFTAKKQSRQRKLSLPNNFKLNLEFQACNLSHILSKLNLISMQCGNQRIFLLTIFYVKSILAIYWSIKRQFWYFLEALDFAFGKYYDLIFCKNTQNQNSESLKLSKDQFFSL